MTFRSTGSSISVFSLKGPRKTQEDRYLIVPDLARETKLLAVMDGTVGEFVVQRVRDVIEPFFKSSKAWNVLVTSESDNEQETGLLVEALRETIKRCDEMIISECIANHVNYSACTLVICLLLRNEILITAHLGDSRAALIHKEEGYTWGEFLTADHKPDLPGEKERIEANGGSVVYLASRGYSTPFLRGGDFASRKSAGDQPMQLQYSRALGGKDLKPFGLSSEPDIKVTILSPSDYAVVIGTDGLWDCMTASQTASFLKNPPNDEGEPLAQLLVKRVSSISSDNVTAIVVILTS
jgi:serine/threonine protein phosphatase PrpC